VWKCTWGRGTEAVYGPGRAVGKNAILLGEEEEEKAGKDKEGKKMGRGLWQVDYGHWA
jgi:hypothetical protein